MGAKMKYVCTSYGAAEAILQDKQIIEVGHNTYLRRLADNKIGVHLHRTDVVVYYKDGTVELNSGGFETVTTKDRMNKFSPVGVQQTNREWFMRDSKCTPFHDFIRIKDGEVIA